MGQRHCRVLSNLRKTHLVGVYDQSVEVGNRVAKQFEVEYFPDLDQLLEKVDAVVLASPTPTHYEQAMKCLSACVHVLVEKPITETLEQAEKLVTLAEKSKIKSTGGAYRAFQSRLYGAEKRAGRAAADGNQSEPVEPVPGKQ